MAQECEMGLPHPLLPTDGAPNWGLSRFSKQFRKVNSQKFGPYRMTELAVDLYFRLAVDRGVKRDHHPDGGAGVRPYFGTIKLEY